MQKVSLVILNYKGKENTLACLDSLKDNFLPESIKLDIIVVDNASKDNLFVALKTKYPNVVFIENKNNLGFAEGNNVGIKYATEHGTDFVLILNNDTIVDKNLIRELLEVAETNEKIGIVVPKIYFAHGFEFHKDRYSKKDLGRVFWYAGGEMDWKNVIGFHRGVDEVDRGQYDRIEKTDFASGCCMLVKREVFEKVGFFDEKFFLYYEDSDLCERIRRAGYSMMYSPKAILWHKNAGSAGGSGSKLQDYYITRNRLLFGIRYAPFRSKLALMREGIELIFRGREWQRQGVLDFYLARFGRGSFKI